MNIKILLLLIILPILSFGQIPKRYIDLHKGLEKIDCKTTKTNYKNGKPKYCGTTTYYKYENKEYAFLTGQHIGYYKDGCKNVSTYDIYGNVLLHEFYDKNGVLTTEHETILLDSSAKDLKQLLEDKVESTFIQELREYKISKNTGKRYLFKKGRYTNGKKSGVWTYYFPDGSIKKEIVKNKNVVQQNL